MDTKFLKCPSLVSPLHFSGQSPAKVIPAGTTLHRNGKYWNIHKQDRYGPSQTIYRFGMLECA